MKDENDAKERPNKTKQKAKVNKNSKKTNRGHKKKKETLLCMMSTNSAQLKGKLNSFKSELKQCDAGIFTLQETHYATKGKVQIFYTEYFYSGFLFLY